MNVTRRFGLTAILLLVLALVAACGQAVQAPEGKPFITGEVTKIEGSRVLIEEAPGKEEGSKCWLAVTAETKLLQAGEANGALTPAPQRNLLPGAKVQAWVTGPVLESYPCQGGASALVLL